LDLYNTRVNQIQIYTRRYLPKKKEIFPGVTYIAKVLAIAVIFHAIFEEARSSCLTPRFFSSSLCRQITCSSSAEKFESPANA
jgi:hypothetical protein